MLFSCFCFIFGLLDYDFLAVFDVNAAAWSADGLSLQVMVHLLSRLTNLLDASYGVGVVGMVVGVEFKDDFCAVFKVCRWNLDV